MIDVNDNEGKVEPQIDINLSMLNDLVAVVEDDKKSSFAFPEEQLRLLYT